MKKKIRRPAYELMFEELEACAQAMLSNHSPMSRAVYIGGINSVLNYFEGMEIFPDHAKEAASKLEELKKDSYFKTIEQKERVDEIVTEFQALSKA